MVKRGLRTSFFEKVGLLGVIIPKHNLNFENKSFLVKKKSKFKGLIDHTFGEDRMTHHKVYVLKPFSKNN